MTDRDPKDMTASEMLRYCYSRKAPSSCFMCHKVFNIEECEEHFCHDVFEALADKIDAELAEARELSLRQGAELWAKANGWPDFKDGEDFGAWLDRCALMRPRYDHDEGNITWCDPSMLTHERPVLGADGKPIVVGETVYSVKRGTAFTVTAVYSASNVNVLVANDDNGSFWSSGNYFTHTPPDTQERIDEEARNDGIAYWDCLESSCDECPARINGKTPAERYGTPGDCDRAMILDLLRRQRELDKRTGGDA